MPLAHRGVDIIEYQSFSFNGEPQAEANFSGNACGLPLND
jgi:hypothetical protein